MTVVFLLAVAFAVGVWAGARGVRATTAETRHWDRQERTASLHAEVTAVELHLREQIGDLLDTIEHRESDEVADLRSKLEWHRKRNRRTRSAA